MFLKDEKQKGEFKLVVWRCFWPACLNSILSSLYFLLVLFFFLDPLLPTVAQHVPNMFCTEHIYMCVCIFPRKYCHLMVGHIQHLGKIRLIQVPRAQRGNNCCLLWWEESYRSHESWVNETRGGVQVGVAVPGVCLCDEEHWEDTHSLVTDIQKPPEYSGLWHLLLLSSQEGSDTAFHHPFVLSGLFSWGSATRAQAKSNVNNHAISNLFIFFSHFSTVCTNVSPTCMPKLAESQACSLCGKRVSCSYTQWQWYCPCRGMKRLPRWCPRP